MRFTGHMVVPIKIAKTIPARQGLAASRLPQGRRTRAVDQDIMAILAICRGKGQVGRRLKWHVCPA